MLVPDDVLLSLLQTLVAQVLSVDKRSKHLENGAIMNNFIFGVGVLSTGVVVLCDTSSVLFGIRKRIVGLKVFLSRNIQLHNIIPRANSVYSAFSLGNYVTTGTIQDLEC